MFFVGCHLSSSKGFFHMAEEALSIGANTFQFFTRNPRGGNAKSIDPEDVQQYLSFSQQHLFGKIVAHGSYTLNLSAANPDTRDFAIRTMKDDLQRMEYIPGNLYNFHPGSHVKQGEEIGIKLIAEALDEILWPQMNTTVLLETMAGKGSEVGKTFEQLQAILSKVQLDDSLGICLDTCHIFDGGYDIVNRLDEVLHQFDEIIGLHRLKAVHINDSKNPLESHKDRHAKLGEGMIGTEAIVSLINHPLMPQNIPFVLETPNDLAGYASEIAFLKQNKVG